MLWIPIPESLMITIRWGQTQEILFGESNLMWALDFNLSVNGQNVVWNISFWWIFGFFFYFYWNDQKK